MGKNKCLLSKAFTSVTESVSKQSLAKVFVSIVEQREMNQLFHDTSHTIGQHKLSSSLRLYAPHTSVWHYAKDATADLLTLKGIQLLLSLVWGFNYQKE